MSINERLNVTTTLLLAWSAVAATMGCAVSTDEGEGAVETQDDALMLPPGVVTLTPLNPITRFPRPRPNLEALVEISAGRNHTCVRKLNGKVYCWGMTSYGQAGTQNTTCYQGVPCVTAPTFTGVVANQVELGYDHTCAVDTAGQGICWGANHNMQLGNGAWSQSSNFPASAQPAKFNGAPIIFSRISAGDFSTCGIAASNGSVFCWGIAGPGAYPSGTGNPNPAPLMNSGGIVLDRIDSISTGFAGACITFNLTNNLGTENYCFLGMSANGRANLNYAWDSSATRISAQSNSYCADKANGTVECFGSNMLGELGNGTTANSSAPVTVGNGTALHGVSMGEHHACALDATGNPLCWGNGVLSPVPVATPVPLTQLASGDLHTCGLGTDGHIYCWGNNTYGQIGNGSFQNTNVGVTVLSDPL
jgi:alpha-tubulin suppressor-like RCC1 family protein